VNASACAAPKLVVREDQVGAAALHVDLRAQPVQRDRRALHVPARAPDAQLALPGRLAGPRHPPEQRVHRVPLAGPLRVAAALAGQPAHRRLVVTRLVAELLGRGAVVVDVRVLRVVDPVGRAGRQQLGDQLTDLRHGLHRTDEVLRRQHPQRLHVLTEQRRLPHAQHDPVAVVTLCALQQRLVDVGDVLHVEHVMTGVPPHRFTRSNAR